MQVPLPTAESTITKPPDCPTKPWIWLRPSPVPFPASLVVKNDSKIRSINSAGMPLPVSLTDTTIHEPDFSRGESWRRRA